MIRPDKQIARGGNAGDSLNLFDDAPGRVSSTEANSTPAARVLSSGLLPLRNIPEELRARPQWVAARIVPSPSRPDKTDKCPVDPATGANAASNDSTSWGTFDEAVARMKRDGLQAVGFVFTSDDPYCGIDFDGVIDDAGELQQWARDYLCQLNSYAERSQSGKGLHIIVRAQLPTGGRKRGQVEMYDRARFFVFTGDVIDVYNVIRDAQVAVNLLHRETFGEPQPLPEPTRQPAQPVTLADSDLIEKAMSARNGAKFAALWGGSTAGYPS